jgi:arylsulfatase
MGTLKLQIIEAAKPEVLPQRLVKGANHTNVILIVLDAVRADHLKTYGYERDTMPWLNSIRARGVTFSNAYSLSSWTKPSIASMLTGQYPDVCDVYSWNDKLPEPLVTLPEELKIHGYLTAAFCTNPIISEEFNFSQGFDQFFYILARGTKQLLFPGDIGSNQFGICNEWAYIMDLIDSNASYGDFEIINKRLLLWLNKRPDNPFFLYIHAMEPHQPYFPDELFYSGNERLLNRDFQYIKRLHNPKDTVSVDNRISRISMDRYDDEIRSVDRELEKLFEALDEVRVLDSSLIVITADHGEEFQDHGYCGHGHSMFQEVIRVPLVVLFPNDEFGGITIDDRVDHLDLCPTIYDYLGINFEHQLEGNSLLGLLGEQAGQSMIPERPFWGGYKPIPKEWPIQKTYALIDGDFKYIHSTFKDPTKPAWTALFNLADDPGEIHDLSAKHPEIVTHFVTELKRLQDYCTTRNLRGGN